MCSKQQANDQQDPSICLVPPAEFLVDLFGIVAADPDLVEGLRQRVAPCWSSQGSDSDQLANDLADLTVKGALSVNTTTAILRAYFLTQAPTQASPA